MRFILATVLLLVVLVGAAALALPSLVPQTWLNRTIVTQLEAATGREVTVAGDAVVRLLPRPALSLGDVTVANTQGFAAPHLARADDIAAELALWPLLSRRVEVARFVVTGLEVDLERRADGQGNWEQPSANNDTRAPAPPTTPDGTNGRVTDITLGDVRLRDSTVRWRDEAPGIERTIGDIDGSVTMATLAGPADIELAGVLDEETFHLGGTVDNVAALLASAPAAVALTARGPDAEATFEGEVVLADEPAIEGALTMSVADLPRAAGWLAGYAVDLPATVLSIEASLQADAGSAMIDPLTFAIDDLDGSGRVDIALAGERPAISGRVDLGNVDVGAFTAGSGEAEPASGQARTGPPTDTPLRFTPLPVDLDLAVSLTSLTVPPLRLGAGAASVMGDASSLTLTVERLETYDGIVAGVVSLAPHEAGLAVEPRLRLQDVRTGPLLADLVGSRMIDGRADFQIDVQTSGADGAGLLAALDGSGSFSVDDAVLSGLAGRPELEAVRTLLMLGGEPGAPVRLAGLQGTFQIDDGVVANDDLRAETPGLAIDGAGRVDIARSHVPGYTLSPTATGPLTGVGDLQRFLIPLRIEGPFAALQVGPDPEALARRSLDDATGALRAAEEQVRQGDVEGATETILEDALGDVLRGFGIRP